MTNKEIFENVNKVESNEEWIDIEKILNDMDIGYYGYDHKPNTKIKSYWVSVWMCTDTYVGLRAYFFEDEPLALSYQPYRKSDEKFYYVSKKMYDRLKTYVLFLIEDEDEYSFNLLDMDENIGDGYSIDYSNNLIRGLHKHARFNGYKVKIIGNANPKDYISQKLIIEKDGNESVVNIQDLEFPYINKHDEI